MTRRLTKRGALLFVLFAACSPFAAGDSNEPAAPDGGATRPSGTPEDSGGPEVVAPEAGATEGGAVDSGPTSTNPLRWDGDEVDTWSVSNVSPQNQTLDCCSICAIHECTGDVTLCNDTSKKVSAGSGVFASGKGVQKNAEDGFYATRPFKVTANASYRLRVKLTHLRGSGQALQSVIWQVGVLVANVDVFSTGQQSIPGCLNESACAIDSGVDLDLGVFYVGTSEITVFVKMQGIASCTDPGAFVSSVEAGVDFVEIVPN